MGGLGWQELLIILAVALLLFGGTRLAGIGKASGRAIREFKEETRDLKGPEKPKTVTEVETRRDAEGRVVDTTVVSDPVEQDVRRVDAEAQRLDADPNAGR